jgi:hypothetical protein
MSPMAHMEIEGFGNSGRSNEIPVYLKVWSAKIWHRTCACILINLFAKRFNLLCFLGLHWHHAGKKGLYTPHAKRLLAEFSRAATISSNQYKSIECSKKVDVESIRISVGHSMEHKFGWAQEVDGAYLLLYIFLLLGFFLPHFSLLHLWQYLG